MFSRHRVDVREAVYFIVIASMFFPVIAPMSVYLVIASECNERGNLSVHMLYVTIFQAFTVLKLAEILRFALNDNRSGLAV